MIVQLDKLVERNQIIAQFIIITLTSDIGLHFCETTQFVRDLMYLLIVCEPVRSPLL